MKSRFIAMIAAIVSFEVAGAQEMPAHMHDSSTSRSPLTLQIGASAIVAGTAALPGVHDRNLAEGYLTQPMLMGMLSTPRNRFVLDATVNFEKFTLDRGELSAGMYGEGYVDRRHPHTLFHEIAGTVAGGGGLSRYSVTVGKGFVPFGTDDPMSRPFMKYPVNHHLAQILERGMAIGAVRAGAAILEFAKFNGDEPESPTDMPNWDRFGDSWAARLTGKMNAFEVQGSVASVTSPEHPHGGGLDHRKLSTSVRYESGGRYGLAEWARTREMDRDVEAFRFSSFLAEGSIPVGRLNLALRAERTERPEEERLSNLFRTPRPHSDLSILGRTRWNMLTAAVSGAFETRKAGVIAPFLEVSTQHPEAVTQPSVFEPEPFYGASRLWSVSLGMRLGIGMRHARMGRYGVAAVAHAHETKKAEVDHSTMDMK
jgi:hypothetical protein